MWPYFYCISGNLQCIINVFAYSGSAPMDGVQLTVSDIPGASLGQRLPKQLTVWELKFWLSCRGIKTTKLKTKAELIAR